MSFKDYIRKDCDFRTLFNDLKKIDPQAELRNACTKKLDMPDVTFWYKVRNDKFNLEEKEKISKIVGKPINILFPC